MWQHNYTPVAGSVGLSALTAGFPILVLLIMIGIFRKAAWLSSLMGLLGALLVAMAVFGMPANLAFASIAYGAASGLFPIGWVVFTAILLYNITVDTGKFEIVKQSIANLTDDRRLQALLIAFAFGAFIEGAAGFGTPVAVAASMLTGLGFSPFFAGGICLLANTAPVAFGSIATPLITLASITGLPLLRLSAGVGRICAPVSLIIPGYLIMVMGGWKALKGVLPAVILCGVTFAGVQLGVSNFIGPELTDSCHRSPRSACSSSFCAHGVPRTISSLQATARPIHTRRFRFPTRCTPGPRSRFSSFASSSGATSRCRSI